MPSKEELRAYDLDVKSLERPFFSVLPRCYYRPSGEEAILGKVTECKNHLEPFKLEGCSLQCNSTTLGAEQGYIVRLGGHWLECLPYLSTHMLETPRGS